MPDIPQYRPISTRKLVIKLSLWLCFLILSFEIFIISIAYLLAVVFKLDFVLCIELFTGISIFLSIILTLALALSLKHILKIQQLSQHIKTEEEHELLEDLHAALNSSQLCIYYQPIVNLQTGKLIGMETLIRWHHPTKGLILPGDFIHLAEYAGLISHLGFWVLNQGCKFNKELLDIGYDLRIAVNLSPQQFVSKNLFKQVEFALKNSGLPANNLELEITETAMIKNMSRAIKTMNKLSEFGVQLSMDDFGTGYSSLSNLRLFPVHKLKIDKAFVHRITPYDQETNLADTIVQIGHQLKLVVLAEGIETEYQKRYFTQLGCDQGQGFYIAEPMSANDFIAYLKRYT